MNLREITIGRSKNCDIYLDERCRYASGMHGTLYYDGNQLMFRDTSTNGTMINNVSVKHRAVPVHHGDIIMLAGKYQVNWNQIDEYFPSVPSSARNVGTITDTVSVQNTVSSSPDLAKWNWGAFGIYPIWGFANGCWWAIFVSMCFGWFWPLPNILFGVYGNRLSWTNKHWNSVSEFEQSQKDWAVWGIILSCIGLFVWLSMLSMLSAFAAIL